MADTELIKLDGIKWWINTGARNMRIPIALCLKHDLRLRPVTDDYATNLTAKLLICSECETPISLPRQLSREKQYVLDKVDAKVFKGMKVINMDDEAVLVGKDKTEDADHKYWIQIRIFETKKIGKRMVIYAGEKGKKNKTQIFIEPDIKRVGFDQNDDHPNEVFAKVEAQFIDGSKAAIDAPRKPA